jgi:UDP-N-acetylmuramate: L-alanyl-gamma-D-glutamyl-meso-diaminopimelate ligase
MHIHILGICGTAMGGIALLARAAGHTVTGCDTGVYPPMSTQLQAQGIDLIEGWGSEQLLPSIDLYVIGNALSRGNPLVEAILNKGLNYTSGAQWLSDFVLHSRWVLAVAGTHGKTITSAMLAWMLECAGFKPGFLIGGVPHNFGISARLGESDFFVIEADEYDTAFFDKRSKFVHYRPRTAILNNLEFDHADIFPDLAAIETQFHHLVRTVPSDGAVVVNAAQDSLQRVLARGCWSDVVGFDGAVDTGWTVGTLIDEGSYDVLYKGVVQGTVRSTLTGAHNRSNVLAAVAAARHIGIAPSISIAAMGSFESVKRRMELRGTVNGITVIDDFAHHPTAIATTLAGLRGKVGAARILAVLEPRSNTMKLGVMKDALAGSLVDADRVFGYGQADGKQALGWDLAAALAPLGSAAAAYDDLNALVSAVVAQAQAGDHIVCMSNGGFGGVHDQLLDALRLKAAAEGSG